VITLGLAHDCVCEKLFGFVSLNNFHLYYKSTTTTVARFCIYHLHRNAILLF